MANYTLCEMRSFVSPACSTHFNISGTAGASMQAHCEDVNDPDAYHLTPEQDPSFKGDWPSWSTDWKVRVSASVSAEQAGLTFAVDRHAMGAVHGSKRRRFLQQRLHSSHLDAARPKGHEAAD